MKGLSKLGCRLTVLCLLLVASNSIAQTRAVSGGKLPLPATAVSRTNQVVHSQVVATPLSDPIHAISPRTTGPAPEYSFYDFYDEYLAYKLDIGTRFTHFILLKSHKGERFNGSFVGSITELKDDQNYLPLKLFVQYRFLPYLGAGLSYDSLSVSTWDEETSASDGDCEISGPMLYLLGCYPNTTLFTPFCEMGLGFYSATFKKSSGWGHEPGKDFHLKDPVGFYLAAGCDALVSEYVSIDLYLRYLNADVKGTFTDPPNADEPLKFTMSSVVLGLGAKFTF